MRVASLKSGRSADTDNLKRVSQGGEARIYEWPHDPALMAKVYLKPTVERADKLRAMIQAPPIDPPATDGRRTLAWPVDLLIRPDQRDEVVGFLMPRATGGLPIIKAYNPELRRKACPGFHYRYLLTAARNLAALVKRVHAQGYVIADLRETNLIVYEDATVTLVDVDSFQVTTSGRVYRCPVGTPDYTAPELFGRDFAQEDRRPEQDRFALGVLIFQLLMEGAHPFDGRWTGAGDAPLREERIRDGYFPHGLGTGPIHANPKAVPFTALPVSVRRLMLSCFAEGHASPGRRPTPQMWLDALDRESASLVHCDANANHIHFPHVSSCPWCLRAVQLGGRDPFPGPRPSSADAGPNTARGGVWRNPVDGQTMMYVASGRFVMGSARYKNEEPAHPVLVDDYWIGQHPVTVAQYRAYCQATGARMPGAPGWGWVDDHPMVGVNWSEAQAYADWAGLSLPTEAQWEKAARGTDEREYPWGSDFDMRLCVGAAQSTARVGSIPGAISPFGLTDMAGNVWEWCRDWYASGYDPAHSQNPSGPGSGDARVVRGGGWSHDRDVYFRTTLRGNVSPAVSDHTIGFRCVRNSIPAGAPQSTAAPVAAAPVAPPVLSGTSSPWPGGNTLNPQPAAIPGNGQQSHPAPIPANPPVGFWRSILPLSAAERTVTCFLGVAAGTDVILFACNSIVAPLLAILVVMLGLSGICLMMDDRRAKGRRGGAAATAPTRSQSVSGSALPPSAPVVSSPPTLPLRPPAPTGGGGVARPAAGTRVIPAVAPVRSQPVVANVRTGVYHRSTCGCIRVMAVANQVRLPSAESARRRGYRVCTRCLP